MVAKTCRCLICRARKVKCDQDWPECGQCKRGKRQCPGPPSSVKFVPSWSAKEKKRRSPAPVQTPKIYDIVWTEPKKPSNASEVPVAKVEFQPRIASTSYIPPSPPATSALRVAMALVHTVSIETATSNPALLGAFIKHVPSMLESSAALTASVACCLEACQQRELHPRKRKDLNIQLYGQALKSIHLALQDREQRDSDATFLAVVLMQRIETALVTKGIARIPCWSVHAGGVSELLKHRGVFDPANHLIFETMLENIGPIVAHWVEKQEDCFLEAPEWQTLLHSRENTNISDQLLLAVIGQLIFLPRLLRLFHEARAGDGSAVEAMELAMRMATALREVDNMLGERLLQDNFIGHVSDLGLDAPVNCFYQDVKQKDARAICWHVILSIIINNALVALVGLKGSGGCSKDFSGCVQELKRYNLILSRRVCMLAEEAQLCGLMVYYFYTGALVTSYNSAQSEGQRRWILDVLNELHRSDESDALWTHEIVERSSRAFAASD